MWLLWWLLLAVMTILPFLAVVKLQRILGWRFIAGYSITISVLTILLYRADKHRAQAGKWRIPEAKLHLLEVAGGWVGAYFSQRLMRHKIRKVPYQIRFWAIGLAHQYIALDYLNEWGYSQHLFAHFMK